MKTPTATYRLQLQPDFGFGHAAEIVSYLGELGISHIYASPIFRARKGSRHGYDVVDFDALNPELGSPGDWQRLVARLRKKGMGWLQDIVPNHMAFHGDNRMLSDVLEFGLLSRFRDHFDICWDHPMKDLQNRVMAPFLGQPYSACLINGEIRLTHDAEGLAVTYGDLKFPLRIESYLQVLAPSAEGIDTGLGDDDPDQLRWIDALDALESLVLVSDPAVRHKHERSVKQSLWELRNRNGVIRRRISEALELYNGKAGDIDSFQRLDRLLSDQHFRLCYWKNANEEINYRRFFDINELIALRQQSRPVFEHTHKLLLELAAGKIVTGVRVDHVDGLAEPQGYLQRLRRSLGEESHILVEKILAPEEGLPSGWPVEGTTGYDFTHWLNALFVCRRNEAVFNDIYIDFSGRADSFEDVVYAAKKWVLSSRMAGDLDNLSRRLETLSALKRFADNLTLSRIREALTELLARFPVYRTYLWQQEIRDADRDTVRTTIARAADGRPHLRSALAFIQNLLLDGVRFGEADDDADRPEQCRRAIGKFQQLSAALMAKGCEDTAFYRYNRFVSLNEVGGDPARFGCRLEQFHAFVARRWADHPNAMNGTATHDSKRGEDMRARLNVLSEIPQEWRTRVDAWHTFVRNFRIRTAGGDVPDRNTEYLFYQILVGAWPQDGPVTQEFVDRIQAYMKKAAREAGEHTSWLDPQKDYEKALEDFVNRVLAPLPPNEFLPAFVPFCKKVAFFGLFNSLAQCLLKIAAPGVPDFYQGTELIQLDLVDPDNRRPVDYRKRQRMLKETAAESIDPPKQIRNLLSNRNDGRIKLFVTARALEKRRQMRDLFLTGDYIPLQAEGAFRGNVIAFGRRCHGQWCIAMVPRFVTALVTENQDPLGKAVWQDTAVRLPSEAPRHWRDVFTRQRLQGNTAIDVGEALRHFPVSMLLGDRTS